MSLKNVAALLRKYSSSLGEKLPFAWPIDTALLRALGWDFFVRYFFLILDLILCIVMSVKELLSIRGIHMDRKISRITLKTLAYLLFFIAITNLAVISQAQAGELYQWKDKDGNVYVSDTPPDASLHQGEVKSTYAPEEPAAVSERKTTGMQAPAVRQKEVTIYTNKT